MALQSILVSHGLITAVVVVSLLCGQWPIFQGTLIERIHYFITYGAYDYFLRFVAVIFGSRGRNAVLKVEHYCCDRPNPILQWLLNSYDTQLLLIVFLVIISLLLAGFFGYHAHLCLTNTTTNETFKWEEYISWMRKVNEAKASAAAVEASINAMTGEAKASKSKWRSFFHKSLLQNVEVVVKDYEARTRIRLGHPTRRHEANPKKYIGYVCPTRVSDTDTTRLDFTLRVSVLYR